MVNLRTEASNKISQQPYFNPLKSTVPNFQPTLENQYTTTTSNNIRVETSTIITGNLGPTRTPKTKIMRKKENKNTEDQNETNSTQKSIVQMENGTEEKWSSTLQNETRRKDLDYLKMHNITYENGKKIETHITKNSSSNKKHSEGSSEEEEEIIIYKRSIPEGFKPYRLY